MSGSINFKDIIVENNYSNILPVAKGERMVGAESYLDLIVCMYNYICDNFFRCHYNM